MSLLPVSVRDGFPPNNTLITGVLLPTSGPMIWSSSSLAFTIRVLP